MSLNSYAVCCQKCGVSLGDPVFGIPFPRWCKTCEKKSKEPKSETRALCTGCFSPLVVGEPERCADCRAADKFSEMMQQYHAKNPEIVQASTFECLGCKCQKRIEEGVRAVVTTTIFPMDLRRQSDKPLELMRDVGPVCADCFLNSMKGLKDVSYNGPG